MPMINFVKIPKTIQYEPWFTEKHGNTLRVYITLHLMVKHEPETVNGHRIGNNEIFISRSALAERLNLTEKKTRTALEKLKATGYITTRHTNTGTVITLTPENEKGFAPLPRTVTPYYDNQQAINEFRFVVWCYIQAAHPDTEYNGVSVRSGTFLTDYTAAASGTGLTVMQIRYMLTDEQRTRFITLTIKRANEKRPKNRTITMFYEHTPDNFNNQKGQRENKRANERANKRANENEQKTQYSSGFAENQPEILTVQLTDDLTVQSNISSIENKYIYDNHSINQSNNNSETANEKANEIDFDLIDKNAISLDDIRAFFKRYNLTINPDDFYTVFYLANGKRWLMENGEPINNVFGFARTKNKQNWKREPVTPAPRTEPTPRTVTAAPRTPEPVSNNDGASYDINKAIAKSNSIPHLDKAHKDKLNQINGTDTATGTGTDTQNGNNTEFLSPLERRQRGL